MQDHQITVMFLINLPGIGGAEQQLLELVKGMDKTRFRPIVVSLYPGGPLEPEMIEVPGVEYLSLNRRGRYDFFVLFRMIRLLRQKKVDIIQPFLTPATFLGLVSAIISRTPVKIVTERCGVRKDTSLGNNLYRAFEDFLTRFADCVVPNSEAGRSYLLSRGINPSRIRVIYNGINLDRLTPNPEKVSQIKAGMQLPPDGRVVGILARLAPAKDHVTFLRAAKLISRTIPQTKFAIVGDGSMRADLENLAQELGIATEVTFFGDQRDVGTYLSVFDVACLSSIDLEGCANSALEAMSLGKPVVITDVGGNRELVNHGENGLLIPPRDPQALADNVLTCLEQTEWTQKIGQSARETVLTLFSLDRMINDYQDLYEETFRQKGRD